MSTDVRDKDIVAQLEDLGILHQEGSHAPVDAVGAVALGGVGLGKVGTCAHDTLAGSCLLPGGAVAGHVGEDGGTQIGVLGIILHTGSGEGGIDSLHFFRQTLACTAVTLHLPHDLGAADVLGVPAGQGELGKPLGIGTVGGGLAGGNQLIGSSDGVGEKKFESYGERFLEEIRKYRKKDSSVE